MKASALKRKHDDDDDVATIPDKRSRVQGVNYAKRNDATLKLNDSGNRDRKRKEATNEPQRAAPMYDGPLDFLKTKDEERYWRSLIVLKNTKYDGNKMAQTNGAILFKSKRAEQGAACFSNFYPSSLTDNAKKATMATYKVLDERKYKGFTMDSPATDRTSIGTSIGTTNIGAATTTHHRFPSSEHAYQFAKLQGLDSTYARERVLGAPNALKAKSAASKAAYIKYLLEQHAPEFKTKKQAVLEYERRRAAAPKFDYAAVMCDVLMHKFSQDVALKAALLSTGEAYLAEQPTRAATQWDIGGSNLLGHLLMLVRRRLSLSLVIAGAATVAASAQQG